jgi:hypothetical protein
MKKNAVISRSDDGVAMFWCVGCETQHVVSTDAPNSLGAHWEWNGSYDKPTFKPSILVRSGHFIPEHKGACWCTYNSEHPDKPSPFSCAVCHSHVTDGQIQFLGDCTHKFAGQTVELQPQ